MKIKYFHFVIFLLLAIDIQVKEAHLITHELGSGMVVSESTIANKIGKNILAQGGNAIDAAVATGFALSVIDPGSGSLGGGGFMLIYLKNEEKVINIDYKSKSSRNATIENLFKGNIPADYKDRDITRYGYKSIGIPGTVAGFLKAHEMYGQLPIARIIEPSIKLAGKSDIAQTLTLIKKHGHKGFYSGITAKKIATAMKQNNGLIDITDLENYEAEIKDPISISYREYKVFAPSPPSVGGYVLLQSLNLLENFNLSNFDKSSAELLNLQAQSLLVSHMIRAHNIGDPIKNNININRLLSKDKAKKIVNEFFKDNAINPAQLNNLQLFNEGESTNHFSVIDKNGNAVANTFTLGYENGSRVIIPDTGILMNNQMSNFSYSYDGNIETSGRFSNPLNRLEPNKKSITNMSPTLIFNNEGLFMITGSPGGSRIPAAILRVIVGVLDHELEICKATKLKRIHLNYLPDKILEYEQGINQEVITNLSKKGYDIKSKNSFGSVQSIHIKNNEIQGCMDLRRSKIQ